MPPNKKLYKLVKNLNSLSKKQLHYVLNLIDDSTIEMFKEIFMNLNYNTLDLDNEKSKKMFEDMKKNKEICEALASSDTTPKTLFDFTSAISFNSTGSSCDCSSQSTRVPPSLIALVITPNICFLQWSISAIISPSSFLYSNANLLFGSFYITDDTSSAKTSASLYN